MSATLGAGAALVLVAATVTVYLILRANKRPERVTTPAGPDVISSKGVRSRPQITRRGMTLPKLSRAKPAPDKAPPARVTPVDPEVTGPVVLEAAWSQSVYHGSRGTADGGRVAVRAATARGRSHAYNGDPGQDAAGVAWCDPRGSIFLVVADGLGSKPESGQVARDVVEQVTSRVAELRAADDPTRMLERVVDAVEQTVRHGRFDGASTLAAAEIRLTRDACEIRTWGIGDSEAWLLADGVWKPLHHERRADTENITRHLPGDREMHMRHVRVRRGCVVALASDGFAGALSRTSPVARELAERWRRPPMPLDFLSQVNFEDTYFNDDRAAVVAWIQ